MSDPQKSVFISYRRDVASFIARAIFMDLRANDYDVFMDVETIDSGQFDTIILNQIAARGHFLLVLTPGTLERCIEPGDWLHREIEYAMDLGRNIVPLLINGFSFSGQEAYLTGKLTKLPSYNGVDVPHSYFNEAMTRLRTRFLKEPGYGTVRPAPPTEQRQADAKVAAIVARPVPTKLELGAEDYFNRAIARNDNSDQEIADYNEAIRLNPNYAAAYNNRGVVRETKRDYDGALADYNEAIRLKPDDATAYNNRGNARQAKGNLDAALADYNEAIRLKPDYAIAYNNRGIVYEDKGNLDAALADYNEATRLKPDYTKAYWGLGDCYYKLKRYTESLNAYDRYLALAGNNPEQSIVNRVAELKKKLRRK